MTSVHEPTYDSKEMQPLEYVLASTKDLLSKDHKIRAGLEPASSDNGRLFHEDPVLLH
jgi:hypothetical protein